MRTETSPPACALLTLNAAETGSWRTSCRRGCGTPTPRRRPKRRPARRGRPGCPCRRPRTCTSIWPRCAACPSPRSRACLRPAPARFPPAGRSASPAPQRESRASRRARRSAPRHQSGRGPSPLKPPRVRGAPTGLVFGRFVRLVPIAGKVCMSRLARSKGAGGGGGASGKALLVCPPGLMRACVWVRARVTLARARYPCARALPVRARVLHAGHPGGVPPAGPGPAPPARGLPPPHHPRPLPFPSPPRPR